MIKNIFANFLGKFWSIFSVFIFIPLYIEYLGFESYSVISFTLVVAGLMAILDSGLTATLSRELARDDIGSEDKGELFTTLETLYVGVVSFVILLLFFLSDFIASNWVTVDSFSNKEISFFLKLVGFDFGFQMLLRFYLGGLLGLEKQVLANKLQVLWGVVRNGIVVVVIIFLPNLKFFFGWQAIATIFFALIFRKILRKQLNLDVLGQLYLSKFVLRKVWRFAGGMMLISLVAALNSQMDKIAISRLLNIESLGYYTLAVSLSMGILTIVSPISVALLPRFTSLYSSKKKQKATELFSLINLMVVIIAFSFMANMMFFAKNLLWIWTGKLGLAERAQDFLPIIAVSFAMLSIVVIPYNIAIANGYTRLNNILGLLSLVFTLPGYWLATKEYGGIGAAEVFCTTQIIITIVYYFFINRKFLKIDLRTLYLKNLLLPFLVTVMFGYAFSKVFPSNYESRIFMLFWIGLSTMLTLVGTFFLLVRGETLAAVKKIVSFSKIKQKLSNG